MSINKIVFMGTPEFAVPCLDVLHQNYSVVAVVTQPDKKKGRGQHVQFSPVKQYAINNNIKTYQPTKVKDMEFIEILKKINPDLIVVVAFGQILPEAILNMPKYGCINVHGSLLPRWRGAAPIHWAIMSGDKETGITTMYMDKGLDTGDMIIKSHISITEDMTTQMLHDEMREVGASTLLETVKLLEKNEAPRMIQDESMSTYAVMLNKENTKIDWNKSAEEVHNFIRGLNSWPIAYTEFNNQKLKIWESQLVKGNGIPGEILSFDKNGIIVACGKDAINISIIQPPNKAKMAAGAFVNGHMDELKKVKCFK